MSDPISFHSVMQAIKEPDKYYPILLNTLKFNLKFGSYSVYPCPCEECSKITEEETGELNQKLAIDLETNGE